MNESFLRTFSSVQIVFGETSLISSQISFSVGTTETSVNSSVSCDILKIITHKNQDLSTLVFSLNARSLIFGYFFPSTDKIISTEDH